VFKEQGLMPHCGGQPLHPIQLRKVNGLHDSITLLAAVQGDFDRAVMCLSNRTGIRIW
jgi:hypothetical protein